MLQQCLGTALVGPSSCAGGHSDTHNPWNAPSAHSASPLTPDTQLRESLIREIRGESDGDREQRFNIVQVGILNTGSKG